MDDKGRRTLLGVVAAVLILIALVVMGLQWRGQQKQKESVLPTQPPSWFGTGAGTPGTAPAPAPSGQ